MALAVPSVQKNSNKNLTFGLILSRLSKENVSISLHSLLKNLVIRSICTNFAAANMKKGLQSG
jgi:hypothetical protein